ncbi:ABC transporter substrate-binding protein [Paenibacillus rigui]|uniref:Peptide ABC transporter substrate-binding protein n=1 Tax=Paenibacillus rigui TaxID=554312 RepID=A0A229UQ14_9BACL|nr:ABC transporter substrate-binding protein [Paenibacillus rigui]OXM85463.1 peptide ABC transporter substrate-binding protein [Paenibacillus rigui]
MLVIAGCSGGAGKQDAAGQPSKAADSGSEKVLTIANATDIESFDPQNNNNTQSEAVLVNMFDYLLKNDSSQKKVPGLATSWEKVNDTTWRFKLRQGVKFHNGDPFTAADVKFTFERLSKDAKLKQNTYYKNLKEINIIDDFTVEFVTNGPDPLILNRLSRMGADILPSKYIQEKGIDAFMKEPVGTGPYKFAQWQKDNRVELVKNADYFGGTPKWDKVAFRVIPEASTRVSELLTNGIDIASGVPTTDMKRIQGVNNMKVEQATIQRVLHLIMRTTPGSVTADPKVREAVDLAINDKEIVDSIAGGAGIPTRTSVTPGNFGADPSLYNQFLYDKEKAKALLKEAGYANGGPKVTFSAQVQYKEIAEVAAAMLTEVGFQVNLDILEASKFSEKLNSKKFNELFLLGVGNSLFDASNNYNRFKFENAKGETDYNNPEVEQLLQAADKNMNPEDREKQYQKVQQIFAVDRPTIYLYQLKGNYGIGPKVDYKPRLDEMYFAEEIAPAKS